MSKPSRKRRPNAPLSVDLDSLTADELAEIRAIAGAAGVALSAAELVAPSVPTLAGLIVVARRRAGLRTTPEQAVRMAQRAVVGG